MGKSFLFSRELLLGTLVLSLAACSTAPKRLPLPQGVDIDAIPEPVPRHEPLSQYGNPESYEQDGRRYWVMPNAQGFSETGVASWYGPGFDGKRTSSGETYNMYDMTAAHRALPLPTYVRVKALKTGKSVIVRVNDRGPFKDNRVIDLSYAAAAKLGIAEDGTGQVELTVLNPDDFVGKPAQTAALAPAVVAAPRVSSIPTSDTITAAPVSAVPIATAVAREPAKVLPMPGEAAGVYIQVGAYASEESAGKVRNDLQGMQQRDVNIVPIDSVMGTLHRVRIGPFATADEAEKQFPMLHDKGFYQARIVQK